jgi:hypothetical protein
VSELRERLIRAAIRYATHGGFQIVSLWSTDPDGTCRCPDREHCRSKPGKHPIAPGGRWGETDDPAVIERLLSAGSDPNYGVIPPSDVFIWDVDGTVPVRLAELEARLGPLPATFGVVTPNGEHWYWRWPARIAHPVRADAFEIVTRWRKEPGRGYVVGPYSRVGAAIYVPKQPTMPIATLPETWARAAVASVRRPERLRLDEIPIGARHPNLRDIARTLFGRGLTGNALLTAMLAVNAQLIDPKTENEVRRAIGDVETKFTPDAASGEDDRVRPVLTLLADVEPEVVEWIWQDRIPRGKVTVIDGDPGVGKSTLTLDLAARVTTGAQMPDGTTGVASAGVVLCSAEDGAGDTIRPRVEAAGGDLRKIAVLAISDAAGERSIAIPDDLAALEVAIERLEAALVVIDPLMAHLPGNVNSYRDQDVRRALAPLARIAERTDAAVVVVRHLTKAPGGSPLYRGGGSIGIIGAARSALIAAVDPDDDSSTQRILAVAKSNLAPIAPSMSYELQQVQINTGSDGRAFTTSRIAWGDVTGHTAAQLLPLPDAAEERGAVAMAKDVLVQLLADGSMLAKEVQAEAKKAGVAPRTLDRAKSALGVRSKRDGFGAKGEWSWFLPPKDATDPQRSPIPGSGVERDAVASNGPDAAVLRAAGRIFGDLMTDESQAAWRQAGWLT